MVESNAKFIAGTHPPLFPPRSLDFWGLTEQKQVGYCVTRPFSGGSYWRIRLQRRRCRQTRVWFLGWEDPLEEGTATHSSILVWRIPRTEEPGGPQSMGLKELDTTEATEHTHTHCVTIAASWSVRFLREFTVQDSASGSGRLISTRPSSPWITNIKAKQNMKNDYLEALESNQKKKKIREIKVQAQKMGQLAVGGREEHLVSVSHSSLFKRIIYIHISHHFMANRWGNSGNNGWLYFSGL